jgi:hypothetical protein
LITGPVDEMIFSMRALFSDPLSRSMRILDSISPLSICMFVPSVGTLCYFV